jgi:hypothetical protein
MDSFLVLMLAALICYLFWPSSDKKISPQLKAKLEAKYGDL